ncbi:MAG: NAD(P)/FAD-dependent oxidoreductase, partial [Gemmatimonadales bacterium]
EKICSEYLSPEAVRQLEDLGVLAELRPHAVALDGATIHGPAGARMTGLFHRTLPAGLPASGLSIPRAILDAVLVNAARRAGVRLLEGTTVTAARTERGTVTGVTLRSGGRLENLDARLTVGADGLQSVLARALGGRRREPLRRYGFVAHVAGVPGTDSTAEMHVGRGWYVGLNRLAGGVTNVAVVASARLARLAAGDPERFWFDRLEAIPAVRGRVPRGGIVRRVLAAGPFATRARRVTGAGLLLVGDAADFFDPFTGEGICTALRGAALAAPVIAAALSDPGAARNPEAGALDPYRAARRRAFAGKWAVERLIGYGMLAPPLFDRAVERLARRDRGHTLVGVTGDFIPARAVLNPGFLLGMLV